MREEKLLLNEKKEYVIRWQKIKCFVVMWLVGENNWSWKQRFEKTELKVFGVDAAGLKTHTNTLISAYLHASICGEYYIYIKKKTIFFNSQVDIFAYRTKSHCPLLDLFFGWIFDHCSRPTASSKCWELLQHSPIYIQTYKFALICHYQIFIPMSSNSSHK